MSGEAPHEADSAPSATVDAAAAPGEQRPGVAAAGGAGEAAVPDSEPDKVEAALKVADAAQPLPPSKRQLKRQRRYEIQKAKQEDKKRRRKEERAKMREQGLLQPTRAPPPGRTPEEAAALREERRRKREEFRAQCLAAPRVVIDCGFQGLMKSTEVASLANQIEYCWSTARMSKRPFCVAMHSCKGELLAKLQKAHCDNWGVVVTEQPFEECYAKEKLVYLTADTENELTELRDDEVYIIGGLVDRNRHKDLTARKARALGVRCARLPLAQHATLSGPLVLTVNHVYEMLQRVRDTGDWAAAIQGVLPQRKTEERLPRRLRRERAKARHEERREEERQRMAQEDKGGGSTEENK